MEPSQRSLAEGQPDAIISDRVHSCATPTQAQGGFFVSCPPPLLWRKSTYYWISLISLFLATVLAIIAFSIRTSYRGGAFLDHDHLPVLFYVAAVFIGALPLSGVCALFRYETDVATGWALFITLLLSFLSLGPIFIFSFDSSQNEALADDHSSATLAYIMATFCVISSMSLCAAAGITYLTFMRARSSQDPKVQDVIAPITLGIACLGVFGTIQDDLKSHFKRNTRPPTIGLSTRGPSSTRTRSLPSQKCEDSQKALSLSPV